MDDDTTDAAWDQQARDEQRRREQELLARAESKHRELRELKLAADANFKAIAWAIDRIFRS